jgi:hypothetical protein
MLLQLRITRGYLLPTTELNRSADCLQGNSSVLIPRKTLSSFVKNSCLKLRRLAIDVLFFRSFASRRSHRKQSFPYIVVTLSREYLPAVALKWQYFSCRLYSLPWECLRTSFHCYRKDPYVTLFYIHVSHSHPIPISLMVLLCSRPSCGCLSDVG